MMTAGCPFAESSAKMARRMGSDNVSQARRARCRRRAVFDHPRGVGSLSRASGSRALRTIPSPSLPGIRLGIGSPNLIRRLSFERAFSIHVVGSNHAGNQDGSALLDSRLSSSPRRTKIIDRISFGSVGHALRRPAKEARPASASVKALEAEFGLQWAVGWAVARSGCPK
jgi:hypothetical protein